MIVVLNSLVLYVELCFIGIGAGYALLALLHLSMKPRDMLLFAPAVITTLWILVLNILISLGFSLKNLVWPIWLLTLLLTITGIWLLTQHFFSSINIPSDLKHLFLPLFICVILPPITVWPYFLYGLTDYLGTVSIDAWNYSCMGQYLWQYGRSMSEVSLPLYKYCSWLVETRLTTGALLGFFSPLVIPGETDSVRNLFVAWTLFVFAASCTFFIISTKWWDNWLILILSTIALLIGWGAVPALVTNWDNGLAIYYAPTLAGLAYYTQPSAKRWSLVLAALIAGTIYTYIELAPIILGISVSFFLHRLESNPIPVKSWIVLFALTASWTIVLLLPGYSLFQFFLNQFEVTQIVGPRPGESFANGLLDPWRFLSAFWALGGEHLHRVDIHGEHPYTVDRLVDRTLFAFGLTLLTVVGIISTLKQRHFALATCATLTIIGALVYLLVWQYAYAAYKILNIGWWVICLVLLTGLKTLLDHYKSPIWQSKYFWLVITTTTSLFLGCILYTGEARQIYFSEALSLNNFREVKKIESIANPYEVLLLSRNLLASHWAIYFLRDTTLLQNTRLSNLKSPRFEDFPTEHPIKYLLIDKWTWQTIDQNLVWTGEPDLKPSLQNLTIWSGSVYRLLQFSDGPLALVSHIHNPNGLRSNPASFFWVGQGDTIIYFLSNAEGTVVFSGSISPGPSLPETNVRRIQVSTDHGYEREEFFIGKIDSTIVVPVTKGITEITLHPLDKPSVAQLSNGDPRPLLIGVSELKIRNLITDENPVAIMSIENPNGIEHTQDGKEFFWIGQGDTVLNVISHRVGTLHVAGFFTPGPSLPETNIRSLVVRTDHDYVKKETVIGTGNGHISLPVVKGINRVILHPLDQPTLRLPNDPRPLLLRVDDMQISE